ncbi:ester cyclase [Roseibium sediminis]|uniref:ester cyclase n=1 Tax=Roseibium sediminis TaxID=1775174 RepID=UPI00123D9C9F|nr:ester cyclase [Roseibium sediminis]
MTRLKIMLAASALTFAALSGNALADDRDTVQVFYDYLSNPGSKAHADAFLKVTTADWQSIGDYSGQTKSKEKLVGQLSGFAKLIPDLKWEVQDMYQDGNTIVVRGRATGTPVGPLFGVDGEGRSFDIMSIDIHELKDGAIVKTYHVEDWATALRQLGGAGK